MVKMEKNWKPVLALMLLPMALAMVGNTSTADAVSTAQKLTFPAKTERGQLAGSLVLKWAGYVSKVYGVSPMTWAHAMSGTFAEADIANMHRALGMKTYEAMTSALLGQKVTDAKAIGKLALSSGAVSLGELGSPAGDLVYTMITPCRILDTRVSGGAIPAGATRSFQGSAADFSAQGGSTTDCGIPAGPSAVVMNVTVVNPLRAGYLTAFPFGVTRPRTASINYKAGDVLGNEIIVRQTLGGNADFSFYSLQQANYVADAVGYFMAPVATALDCTTTAATTLDLAANAWGSVASAPCGAGYSPTATNCLMGTYFDVLVGATGGTCYGHANSSAATTIRASQTCCRVPGR